MKNKIKIIPFSKDLQYPTRGHEDDAGIDIYAPYDITIEMLGTDRKNPDGTVVSLDRVLVPFGFGIECPKRTLLDKLLNKHWHAEITQRSSQNVASVILMRGIIDEGYHGEIKGMLINLSDRCVIYKKGDRIGQLLFYKERHVNSSDVVIKDKSKRGTGGFGSTGK